MVRSFRSVTQMVLLLMAIMGAQDLLGAHSASEPRGPAIGIDDHGPETGIADEVDSADDPDDDVVPVEQITFLLGISDEHLPPLEAELEAGRTAQHLLFRPPPNLKK
jgi:hypothetical protein